jgi:hypothetical protein
MPTSRISNLDSNSPETAIWEITDLLGVTSHIATSYRCSDGPLTLVLERKEKVFPFFFDRIFSYCTRIVRPYEFKEPFRLDEYTQTLKPDDVP